MRDFFAGFEPSNLRPFVGVVAFVSLYLSHYWLTHSQTYLRFFARFKVKRTGEIGREVGRRVLFFLMIGVIPAVLTVTLFEEKLSHFGLRPFDVEALEWGAGLTGIFVILSLLLSRTRSATTNYPQIRIPRWSYGTHLINIASWGIYFIGYEFGYRGFLLFLSVDAFGVWPAIAINMAFYAALHMPKGALEALGSLPLGLLFSASAVVTGSIWAPFLAHFLAAIVNDFLSFKANPYFVFVRRFKIQE